MLARYKLVLLILSAVFYLWVLITDEARMEYGARLKNIEQNITMEMEAQEEIEQSITDIEGQIFN